MRLKSEIWVMAYVRKLAVQGIWAAITRRGDPDAGVVFVCVNTLDGNVRLFGPAYGGAHDDSGGRRWRELTTVEAMTEKQAADILERQVSTDTDIWIVEIENKSGDPVLDNIVAD